VAPSIRILSEAQPTVYKRVELPEPSNAKFQPVYMTNVVSPSCLHVKLIGKETTQVLECLQEDMALFYKTKEDKEHGII